MNIIRTTEELRRWRAAVRAAGRDVVFVPTMGFLHRGHQALMRAAVESGGELVVSIFVNPMQFGPGEDFERYPRDEVGDLGRIREVDPSAVVFVPSVTEMYPPGFSTRVIVSGVTAPLCGRSRPGHFEGVSSVVARLFGLVQPTRAYFGLKDYQQVATIRRMVADLALPVEIVGCPTVREVDGLALSSRNVYLGPEDREAALSLSRGLARGAEAYAAGERDPSVLEGVIGAVLQAQPGVRVDYVEVLDADHLGMASPDRPMVAAVAAFVGRARLIDNRVYTP